MGRAPCAARDALGAHPGQDPWLAESGKILRHQRICGRGRSVRRFRRAAWYIGAARVPRRCPDRGL